MPNLDEYVFEALKAGAGGFLLKDMPADQLLAGIRGSIFMKLGLRDRVQAVVLAYDTGLVRPRE